MKYLFNKIKFSKPVLKEETFDPSDLEKLAEYYQAVGIKDAPNMCYAGAGFLKSLLKTQGIEKFKEFLQKFQVNTDIKGTRFIKKTLKLKSKDIITATCKK